MHGKILIPGSVNDPRTRLGIFETSDYSAKSYPWMVKFHILLSKFESEYKERMYFLRAPDQWLACFTVAKLWEKWEKIDTGKQHEEYPRVCGPSEATVIDEDDYRTFWKDAKKWPRIAQGHPDNPVAFTYFTDEAYVQAYFGAEFFAPPPAEPISLD